MSEANKDTIYVDIDDEITSIIDKVSSSKHKVVALVLPKRAAVFQSIVNMKLLKRSGDTHKKHLVLITSEASLLPLAGAVKLHVAKTLHSKPVIPSAPAVDSDDVALDEDEESANDEADLDPKKPVGELAAVAGVATLADDDTIDMGEESVDADSDKPPKKNDATASKGKGKQKIPDFNKFRKKLLIGGGILVLVVALWVVGTFILPSAKITVSTDTIKIDTSLDFTADTTAKTLDEDKAIIPAENKQLKKTDTEKVTATGQKNVGDKAIGTVTLKMDNCAQDAVTIPAGTGVASNGLTFITQTDVFLDAFSKPGNCRNDNPILLPLTSKTVKVTAQNPGDQFNISGGRKFTVNGYSMVTGVDSSAMSGGTNKNVTVISQQDVDSAKQKILDRNKEPASSELKKQFTEDNLYALPETFTAGEPIITVTPKVGEEANEATVASIVTYSMLGVKRNDLKTLVVASVKDEIDTEKQSIGDDGLSKATISLQNRVSPSVAKMKVDTTVSTGAEVDEEALKKELTGKKKSEVQQIIGDRPGVKEVDVQYSPFWVYKTPKKTSKITLIFEQANNANNK